MMKTMISIMFIMMFSFEKVLSISSIPVKDFVLCPVLSRTRYKELRTLHFDECPIPDHMCFQQILLTDIIKNHQQDFLFSSGCITPKTLKIFELNVSQFKELCQKTGVNRCIHRYNQTMYEGTICCENNSDEIFESWLWDAFFGENEELKELLDNTVRFMQRENNGKIDDHDDIGMLYVIGPFFVTAIFTVLSLLQYYHINDGILS